MSSGSTVRSRTQALVAGLVVTVAVAVLGLAALALLRPSDGGGPVAAPPVTVVPAPPQRLRVAALGVDAPVVPIRLGTDAVLRPPEDPDVVGWWDGSAQPGDPSGRVVLTGHTIHDGDGALDRLVDLRRGRVVLRTDEGAARYRVTDRYVVPYAEVAERARDIFGQTEDAPDGAWLVLVTCTDWNGSVFESNVIVVAEPV